ncbi:hypothetical protein F4859DRAFT_490297 [Xylaria cf. heliscus]|nr:hypothetical protein F4859DRAFT_490297 [Xylaria cf. heliscus]
MSLTINQRTATLGPLRPPQLWYRFQYPEDSWTEGDPPIDFYLSVETVFRIFNRLGEYLEEYAPAWDTEPLLLQPKDAHRSLLIIFAAIFNEMNWIECYFPTLANQNIENLVRFMDFHACEEKLDYDATHRLYNWLIRASTLPRSASLRHDRLWLAEFIHAGIVLMRVDKRAWPIFYTCEDGTIQVAIQSNSVEHHLKHFYNAAIADNETTWEMWLRLLALAKCFEQNVLQDRISWHMAFTTKYWDRKTHKCPRTLLYLLGTCNEVHGRSGTVSLS